MKVEDFLDYVREAKSKATFKNYTTGLNKFVEWYGKSANEILKERFEDLQSTDQNKRKRFNREIEKFHRYLKNLGHPQNTAVAYTEGIRQLFRYFDMDIKNLPSEVTRKTTTVKDYVPSVSEYRDMFNCGILSSHISKLEAAGYVEVTKEFLDKKPHTALQLTNKGRAAFQEYRQSMEQIFNELPERAR